MFQRSANVGRTFSELANYFLDRHRTTKPLKLSSAAAAALEDHQWPGMSASSRGLMERAVALAESDVIELDDLPPAVQGGTRRLVPRWPVNDRPRAWVSSVRTARAGAVGRQPNARPARLLGISYHTLQALLRYPIHDAVDAVTEWTKAEGVGAPEAMEV